MRERGAPKTTFDGSKSSEDDDGSDDDAADEPVDESVDVPVDILRNTSHVV